MTNNKKRHRTTGSVSKYCICNNEKQCRGMSLAFQMLDDPRGGYVEMPPPGGDNPEGYEFIHRMNALRQAYLRHLNQDNTKNKMVREVENQTTKKSGIITGAKPAWDDDNSDKHQFHRDRQQQRQEFVALHHFPPTLIRKLARRGEGNEALSSGGRGSSAASVVQVPPTLRLSELKRLGWKPLEVDRVCYDNDQDGTSSSGQQQQPTMSDEYYCVPSYPMADAHNDLKLLAKAERSTKEISTSVYQNALKAIEARKKKEQNDNTPIRRNNNTKDKQQQLQHQQQKDVRAQKDTRKNTKKQSTTATTPTIVTDTKTGCDQPQGRDQQREKRQDGASTGSEESAEIHETTPATKKEENLPTTTKQAQPVAAVAVASEPTTSTSTTAITINAHAVIAAPANPSNRPTDFKVIGIPKEAGQSTNIRRRRLSMLQEEGEEEDLGDSNATCVLDESENMAVTTTPRKTAAAAAAAAATTMDVSDKTQLISNRSRHSGTMTTLDVSDKTQLVSNISNHAATRENLDISEQTVYGSYGTLGRTPTMSDISDKTVVYGSYFTRTASETGRNVKDSNNTKNTGLEEDTPSSRNSAKKQQQQQQQQQNQDQEQQDLGDSNTTVVIGDSSHHSARPQQLDMSSPTRNLAKKQQQKQDLGDSNTTVVHGDSSHHSARTPMDISDKTVYGSYFTRTASETGRNVNNNNSQSLGLSSPSRNVVKKQQQQQQDLGDSNATVVLGESSHHSALYASAVSLEITDPSMLLKTSGHSMHASDITEKACGAGPSIKPLHASDTTIQTSNILMAATTGSSALGGLSLGGSSHSGDLSNTLDVSEKTVYGSYGVQYPSSRRVVNTITVSALGAPEKKTVYGSYFTRTASETSRNQPRNAGTIGVLGGSIATGLPVDSDHLSNTSNLQMMTTTTSAAVSLTARQVMERGHSPQRSPVHGDEAKLTARQVMELGRPASPMPTRGAPMPPPRVGIQPPKISTPSSQLDRDFPLEVLPRRTSNSLPSCELLGEITTQQQHMRKPRSSLLEKTTTTTNSSGSPTGASRFHSSPKAIKINDSSPITPRRMVSRRTLESDDESDEGEKQQKELIAKTLNECPSCDGTELDEDMAPAIQSQTVGEEDAGKTEASNNDDIVRQSTTQLTTEPSEPPAPRRGAATQLDLLDTRVRKFHDVPRHSNSRHSVDGPQKSLPRRSWSGDSLGSHRRPKSRSLCIPPRSKSDSLEGSRRRSASGRMTRSKLGIKCIDTTFRAMQQYSETPTVEERRPSGQHLRRRFSSDGNEKSRSDGPTEDVRRGRRRAIVASDSKELVSRGVGERRKRTPHRTKSFDSVRVKRNSDPSPSRSRSGSRSWRGIRRTRSVDSQTRRSKSNSRSRGRKNIGRTRSELSPARGHRNVRRLDTTKRAMQQYVHNSGTGSDLSTDRSPRRSPRRTRTPRKRSPMRKRTCGFNDGSDPDLTSSSPAALADGSGGNKVRLRASMDAMSASTPGIMTELARLRRVRTDIHSFKAHGQISEHSSSDSRESASGHSSDAKSSSASSDTPDDAGMGSATISHRELTASEPERQSITAAPSNKVVMDESINAAEAEDKESLSESLHERDLEYNNGEAKGNDDSIKLEDINDINHGTIKTASPEGFHYSYPFPGKTESKKDVDWESIGFYSFSERAISRAASHEEEEEAEPTTFGLPWRLVGKKARQQLLNEVVVSAHRRQNTAAKKEEAVRSAKRRESQMVMKEMLAAVKTKIGFGEDVANTAQALLDSDEAGQQRHSFRRKSLEHSKQATSLVSLSLDSVFAESQELCSAQTPDRSNSKSAPQQSPGPNDSSISLSLHRVFQDSSLKESQPDSGRLLPNGSDFDKSGSWGSQQLRAVFPFKTLREKKKGSSHFLNDLSFHSAGETPSLDWTDGAPSRPQQPPTQHILQKAFSTPNRIMRFDPTGSLSPTTSELYLEKLPDISEEEVEPGKEDDEKHQEECNEEVVEPFAEQEEQAVQQLNTLHESLPSLEPMPPSTMTEAEKMLGQRPANVNDRIEKTNEDSMPSLVSLLEPKELNSVATDSASTYSSVPLYVKEKMATLLHEEKNEEDLPAPTPAPAPPTGTTEAEPIVEFHLAFPSDMALAPRALPPTADECLGRGRKPFNSNSPSRRSQPTSVNSPCDQGGLDTIEMDYPGQEIRFVPGAYQLCSP